MSSLKDSLLRTNVGTIDRVARVVLGIVLLSLAFTGPQTAWGFLGVIPLFTAIVGSCPLYSILGLSTCPAQRS